MNLSEINPNSKNTFDDNDSTPLDKAVLVSNMFYWRLRQEAAEFQVKMIQLLKLLTSVASQHLWPPAGGLRTITMVI